MRAARYPLTLPLNLLLNLPVIPSFEEPAFSFRILQPLTYGIICVGMQIKNRTRGPEASESKDAAPRLNIQRGRDLELGHPI